MAANISIAEKQIGILNGQPAKEFIIANSKGAFAGISNYGGIITRVVVPDKNREMGDVVTGFENLEGFLQSGNPYFGAIIGRYANRMARGKFIIDGKEYQLACNAGENSLHGGNVGFDKVMWNVEILQDEGVKLSYISKDGEEGYPGNLRVEIIFSFNEENELTLDYFASTDRPTPVNLTSHPYFNLSAWKDEVINNHELQINANWFTATDETLVPTGELVPVNGSPLDFTNVKTIGKDINAMNGGYDNNYVLTDYDGSLKLAAIVTEPKSGRRMEVLTTEPGLQLYTTNSIDANLQHTKGGIKYKAHGAFCLEAQHFPDSPNHPDFPTTVLHPGETYRQTTVYRFSVC